MMWARLLSQLPVKKRGLTCSRNLEPSAVRLRRPTSRRISAIARRSMPCSIWWATLPSWIRCRCCAVEAACVSPDGWAVSIRSTDSIRCFRCQAGSTSHSLAVLSLVLLNFPFRIFRCRKSSIRRRLASTKQNPQRFSSSTISGTRTKRWSQTSPTARWLFSSSHLYIAAHSQKSTNETYIGIWIINPNPSSHNMNTFNTNPEEYDLVVLGSGAGGKLIAWTSAQKGHRVPAEQKHHPQRQSRLVLLSQRGVRNQQRKGSHQHGGGTRTQAQDGPKPRGCSSRPLQEKRRGTGDGYGAFRGSQDYRSRADRRWDAHVSW